MICRDCGHYYCFEHDCDDDCFAVYYRTELVEPDSVVKDQ